jgi:hypothetical protein
MRLASRFGRNTTVLRAAQPLADEQIMGVAPSIFAEAPHDSRSERYAYIPTIELLGGLRTEGFEPFMVCQTRVRDASRREFTKHMLRLRHASQIATEGEANEIVLLNSHDGTSGLQLLAGVYRYVCQNGMVFGDTTKDLRVPHKGKDVVGRVIEGAYTVLDEFDLVREQRDAMAALTLNQGEQIAFGHAALALRYEEGAAAPITDTQVLESRRGADRGDDLWRTFNRVQENLTKGGLSGRGANGRKTTTRAVNGIDNNVKLNRALWLLAEEMRRLKSN